MYFLQCIAMRQDANDAIYNNSYNNSYNISYNINNSYNINISYIVA